MVLEISSGVLTEIADEAERFATREICGLLLGAKGHIDSCLSCNNVAADPRDAFEIDPAQLIAAYRAERAGGPLIIGCYHSHPNGATMPSARDAEAAAPNGWVWLIRAGRETACYRAVPDGQYHGRFDAMAYRVTA